MLSSPPHKTRFFSIPHAQEWVNMHKVETKAIIKKWRRANVDYLVDNLRLGDVMMMAKFQK